MLECYNAKAHLTLRRVFTFLPINSHHSLKSRDADRIRTSRTHDDTTVIYFKSNRNTFCWIFLKSFVRYEILLVKLHFTNSGNVICTYPETELLSEEEC